ncbi:transglycosylase SLT domain-containing protein [Sinimarinibacterium sp. CAU 1509]|uniref:transglycosylase SLT domain-containing protein n=1 Tax=Sinimarinibacterium sp. CAU 1509 TaxID=2562283 RepID=UPI00146E1290|nr:transglycosylase SLT domain-containing protein [Sinimarinibacterium sp. CAU 1509]
MLPAHAGAIEDAATAAGVDPLVVRAIVITESRGHPWTVNVNGEPFFLASKADAVNLIRRIHYEPWMVRVVEPGKKPVRYFFRTEADATEATRELPKKSYSIRKIDDRMIDIGLMQINLHYHGDQMRSLDEAFSPSWNLSYGSKFLASLVARHGSVTTAIGYYNASTAARRAQYSAKVLSTYRRLKNRRS